MSYPIKKSYLLVAWLGVLNCLVEVQSMELDITISSSKNASIGCVDLEYYRCTPTKPLEKPCCPGMTCEVLNTKYPNRGWCIKKGVGEIQINLKHKQLLQNAQILTLYLMPRLLAMQYRGAWV